MAAPSAIDTMYTEGAATVRSRHASREKSSASANQGPNSAQAATSNAALYSLPRGARSPTDNNGVAHKRTKRELPGEGGG